MSKKNKIAFIHFGKAGGVYINAYFRQRILKNKNLIHKNLWLESHLNKNITGRDWNEQELLEFSKLENPDGFVFVHNHQNNWSSFVLKEYKANGWFTFCFLRDPKDIICSLYFFSKKLIKNGGHTAIGPVGVLAGYKEHGAFQVIDVEAVSLDEFVAKMVEDKNQHIFWKLPDYVDDLSYVKQINEKNLRQFFKEFFDHSYFPMKKLNVSSNMGYNFYRAIGEISDETHEKLVSHPEYTKYKEYLDK